jgi:hypothetical protein
MEQNPLEHPCQSSADKEALIQELMLPSYNFGLIGAKAQAWYWEGYFYGQHDERQVQEAYRDQKLQDQEATIRAYQLIVRALRSEFTHSRSKSERGRK